MKDERCPVQTRALEWELTVLPTPCAFRMRVTPSDLRKTETWTELEPRSCSKNLYYTYQPKLQSC